MTDLLLRTPGKARLAVLFSGGIDSTIITYLANRYVLSNTKISCLTSQYRHVPLDESIDLLNVAFENPRKIKIQNLGNTGGIAKRVQKAQVHRNVAATEQTPVSYRVPDRVTGLTELEELRRICPGRTWNFVSLLSLLHFVTGLKICRLKSTFHTQYVETYQVAYQGSNVS